MNIQAQPPEKKRRKKKTAKSSSSPPPPPPSFFLLPEEIIENCLARVPKSYYPKLSTVSKTFRSLLSSTDVYAARCRLGFSQQCLYICLGDLYTSDCELFQWSTLTINPNLITKTAKKKRTALGQLSVPVPSSNCGTLANPTLAGFEIYVIGGHKEPSSTVRVLDCRRHTSRDAPRMNVARKNPLSCFYAGKIYVMGGCSILEQGSPFAEVFDIKSQSWECLPDPSFKVSSRMMSRIIEIEGRIHLRVGYTLFAYYDPKLRKWENKNATFPWSSECMIDNLWYSFGKHRSTGLFNLWWRDRYDGNSKEVKGVNSLVKWFKSYGGSRSTLTKLATCGGKLYVLWSSKLKEFNNPKRTLKIFCAEISLEKRDGGEIWGNVEWLDVVHTATTSYCFLHCLAISV